MTSKCVVDNSNLKRAGLVNLPRTQLPLSTDNLTRAGGEIPYTGP